jgi:hypothetical protein
MEMTTNETKVYNVIKETMDLYGDGFSDCMVEDIVEGTGLSVRSVKGVLGSLMKKEIVEAMDVNGEYNVYYILGYEDEL